MKNERIISVPNRDKTGQHADTKRPGLYPAHPARIALSGRSGCGKGVAANNLLARASPAFDRTVIWHYDTDALEWDDCDPSDVISELPDEPANFGIGVKTTYWFVTKYHGSSLARLTK